MPRDSRRELSARIDAVTPDMFRKPPKSSRTMRSARPVSDRVKQLFTAWNRADEQYKTYTRLALEITGAESVMGIGAAAEKLPIERQRQVLRLHTLASYEHGFQQVLWLETKLQILLDNPDLCGQNILLDEDWTVGVPILGTVVVVAGEKQSPAEKKPSPGAIWHPGTGTRQ